MALAAWSILLAKPLVAAEYAFSGESNTFLRLKTTIDKKNVFPLYEYLRLTVSVTEKDGSATSLHFGGWGRGDLGDDSFRGGGADGDLQYGYVSYQGARNNLQLNAGRQFVAEGVATERLDGLHLRSDLASGFAVATFAGKPVLTEPSLSGGNFLAGVRLSQGRPAYYSVGLSYLISAGGNAGDREEEGLDLWVHPHRQVDLTGRSTFNSRSSGWMEHAYTLSVAPLETLSVSADLSRINYRDYFTQATTTAFRFISGIDGIIDPNEELTAMGVGLGYSPIKNLTIAPDYRRYIYQVAGDADYFGGKVDCTLPESLSAGFSAHRMSGASDRLRYSDFRVYALKKLGAVDLAADFFNVYYDRKINGVKNSFAVTGSAGYRFNENLRIWTDLEISHSPYFDAEMRGLVKLTYGLDVKRSEGRGKSEK